MKVQVAQSVDNDPLKVTCSITWEAGEDAGQAKSIDWGDGSAVATTDVAAHTYAKAGMYQLVVRTVNNSVYASQRLTLGKIAPGSKARVVQKQLADRRADLANSRGMTGVAGGRKVA